MKEEKQTPALVMGSQLNTHNRRNLSGNIARMSRMLPSNGAFRCPARWPGPLFSIRNIIILEGVMSKESMPARPPGLHLLLVRRVLAVLESHQG